MSTSQAQENSVASSVVVEKCGSDRCGKSGCNEALRKHGEKNGEIENRVDGVGYSIAISEIVLRFGRKNTEKMGRKHSKTSQGRRALP